MDHLPKNKLLREMARRPAFGIFCSLPPVAGGPVYSAVDSTKQEKET